MHYAICSPTAVPNRCVGTHTFQMFRSFVWNGMQTDAEPDSNKFAKTFQHKKQTVIMPSRTLTIFYEKYVKLALTVTVTAVTGVTTYYGQLYDNEHPLPIKDSNMYA